MSSFILLLYLYLYLCCICLLGDWWFRLYHHITYICVLSIFALIWLVHTALFCATIWRNSISLLRYPFLVWNVASYFCSLVIVILLILLSVSFLVAVISPSLCFSMSSSSRCIDASTPSLMLASPLPPSFHSLSTSSLGCNAECMVISFLLNWSICLSSSLVHFKKSPEYLTRTTVQLFILLINFCYIVLSRVAFWFSWNILSHFFSFLSTCLMVSASMLPKYLLVSFFTSV